MNLYLDDLTLATNIKVGDEKAFKTLFDRYYKKLVDYALSYTSNLHEAEDIVQQTFITLWTNRKNINTTKSIKSYLYRITHNSYIDTYRKKIHKESFFDEIKERALRDRINDDDEIIEQRILKLKIIIESLPEKSKEILKLNKFDGLKYKEIADLLGISIKTVEAHMYTAFKKIRKAFKGDDFFLFLLFKIMR